MTIPDGAIFSDDGLFVIGVKDRRDRYGKIMPESEWMYKRPVPKKNMENLRAGRNEKAIEGRKETYVARIEAYLRGLEHGKRRSEAAKSARIAYSTIVSRRKSDPVFASAEIEAEEVAMDKVEDVVWNEIIVKKNADMGMKWLEKRGGLRWKDKKTIENVNTQRLEIDTSDRVKGIIEMMKDLKKREELGSGIIIDAEVVSES